MQLNNFLSQIERKHSRWFECAATAAMAGLGVGGRRKSYRLGAAITDGRRLLSAKYNSYKTHPLLVKFTQHPHLHAEQATIISLGLDNCADTTIYTLRLLRDGQIATAEPCDVCARLMKLAGVRRAYYTTYTGYGVWVA